MIRYGRGPVLGWALRKRRELPGELVLRAIRFATYEGAYQDAILGRVLPFLTFTVACPGCGEEFAILLNDPQLCWICGSVVSIPYE